MEGQSYICPACGARYVLADEVPADARACPACPGMPLEAGPPPEEGAFAPPWLLVYRHGKLEFPAGSDPLGVGEFGRFTVEAVMGRGPDAVVYRAWDGELKAVCALKVFRREVVAAGRLDGEDLMARARAAASIEDEHVVRLLEAGAVEGTWFLASQYVEGRTLADLVARRGQPGWEEAAGLMAGAARGLAAGHAVGLVHGGVKPANVLVTEAGSVKVADFASPPCGAPAFLAPEARAGLPGDHRSDVYALGAVFRRFIAASADGVPAAEATPPEEAFRAILRKCTADRPEDRYADCMELADDLERLVAGLGPARRAGRPGLWLALGLAGAAVLLAFGLYALSGRSPEPSAPGTIPVPERRAEVRLPDVLPSGLVVREGRVRRLKDDAEMVYIPTGTFAMGSSAGPADERPPHRVTVSAFFIDRAEVSVGQYREFLQVEGLQAPRSLHDPEFDRPELPIVGITWYRAQQYCQWAGGRLPTEAEWELAARGPEALAWPWGDEWDPARCNWAGARPAGRRSAPSSRAGAPSVC